MIFRKRVTVLLAGLSLWACRPAAPPPKLFAGGPLPIGEDVYLNPANYGWSFHAKPGETYRITADWPKANVHLVAGSDTRGPTGDDDDDAANTLTAATTASGAHGQQATVVIGPLADSAFIRLQAMGNGSGPMHLRIERGP